jgi:outer membrane protein OmpA-like peptidoglycan-associated protein
MSRLFVFCVTILFAVWFMPCPVFSQEGYLQLAALFDKDNDGIKNSEDECPTEAEDMDNFRDGDGCPDYDNDSDGIPDLQDKCPLEPEDRDGFEDTDGCPDPDNDGDKIPDIQDRCPTVSEDFDGFEDEDGCPDPDNDKDGILDVQDKCSTLPEDRDGFEDIDGCPDPDNDKDGILDAKEKCPNQAETFNGIDDEDGCPDEAVDRIPKGKILMEGIRFSGRTAELDFQSYAVLDSLVKSLLAYPDMELEITAHVDKSGNPEEDEQLAMGMASAVCKYLIQRGVGEERLSPISMGSNRPTSSNVTPQGREENRRIEINRVK